MTYPPSITRATADPDRPPRNLRREFAVAAQRLLCRAHQLPGLWRFQRPLRSVASAISRHGIPSPRSAVVCSTNYGFPLIVRADIDRGVEERIYRTGTYEAGTLAVIDRLLRPGDTVFDVGANIGLMSIFSARLVGPSGHVFAFEPVAEIYRQLRANIALNELDNVCAVRMALGSQRSRRPIYTHPEINRGSASLLDSETGILSSYVDIISMEEFALSHNVANFRLAKVDVEGWELEVIRASGSLLRQPDAPALCIECSTAHPLEGGAIADLFECIMSANRYQCFKLRGGKEVPSPLQRIRAPQALPHHDNIFFLLPSHMALLSNAME